MPISIIDHTAALTSKVVGIFKEDIVVRSGFGGFFPEETTASLEVDVEVERDNDLIAVDVMRFTEGNANKLSKMTENKYIPPYFKEEYYLNRDMVYMNAIGNGVMDNRNINKMVTDRAARSLVLMRRKIERAIRKQQSQVLQTGIVTLKNGDNINYRRKAGSIVVKTGAALWSAPTTATPLTDLALAMTFLRDEGNSNGTDVNVVMRSAAYNAFMATDQVINSADYRRIERIKVDMPQFNDATGMAFQGQVAAGDFVVNLWTYNEKYTDEAGVTQHYLDANKVIVLPNDFQGKTVFGGLPTMIESNIAGVSADIPTIVEANYLIRSFSDRKTISSGLELTSAPLVIPFTIDKIYTMQVLA